MEEKIIIFNKFIVSDRYEELLLTLEHSEYIHKEDIMGCARKLFIALTLVAIGFLTGWSSTNVGSDITTSTTWTLTGSPYIITAEIAVYRPDGLAVLTIEAGVQVKFAAGTSLTIGDNNFGNYQGGLMVNGTVSNPVLFTSNAATPASGDWKFIRFYQFALDSLCRVSYATIEYGGSVNGMVTTYSSAPTFDHCTFRSMSLSSLYPLTDIDGAWVSNCAFQNGGSYAATYYAKRLHRLGTGNTYSGNAIQAIQVLGGTINYTQTWNPQTVPYRVVSDLQLNSANAPVAVVTILPGTVFEFTSGTQFRVGDANYYTYLGALKANNAIFRGVNSTPGYWQGIIFSRYVVADSTLLTNCAIQDGGSSTQGCVRFDGYSQATLTGCTISNSSVYGLYAVDPATPHINGCTFTGNPVPMSIMANDVRWLGSGNVYTGNTDNRIEVRGDDVTSSATWVTQATPLHAIGDINIFAPNGISNLVIQYGAELQFASGIRLLIGDHNYNNYLGSLTATGVTFRGDVTTPGRWVGLSFERWGTQSTLSGCIIRDAGGSYNRSVYVYQVTPVVTGCQILNGQGNGIYLENGARPQLSGNRVSGNSGYPLNVFANDVGSLLPGNDFTGNGTDVINVRAGTVSQSAVWENPGVPFALSGDVAIDGTGNPHVEIRPGNVVLLPDYAEISIGDPSYSNYPGSLIAEDVTFSRLNPTDIPKGLYFARYADDSQCRLHDCTVEYFGASYGANIYCYLSNPTLDGVISRYGTGYGLRIGDGARPTVTNCRFESNASYPVYVFANDLYSLGTGNTCVGNSPNRIKVNEDVVAQTQTWVNQGIPLEINGEVDIYQVGGIPVLTINSGSVLQFIYGGAFRVGDPSYSNYRGALRASGVTFTALNPAPGAWQGIGFERYLAVDSCRLERCVVEYGGYGTYHSNIHIFYTSPSISECLIRHSDEFGIYVANSGANPSIYKCTITSNSIGIYCSSSGNPLIGGAAGNGNAIMGNTTWGVQNITSSITVNATYNWWGDVSGPDGAGPGIGDSVSTYVNFNPWRTTNIGDAPSLFSLISPTSGDTVWSQEVLFDWETAMDPTPNDTVRYKLQISTVSNFAPANTVTIDSLLESQYPATLNDDTRYWWKVTAFDTQGQNTNCTQQNWNFRIFVIDPPSAFNLLTPDSMATVMVTSPLLSWQTSVDPDPGDAVTYTVYIDVTAGFTTADSAITTQTGIYPPFCAPATLRYWKVKATDTWGSVQWSRMWRFYVHEDAGPRPIHDLVVGVLGDDIQLSWSEVAGADRYDIYTSTSQNGTFTYLNNTTSLSFTDIGAVSQARLFYRVIAVDNDLMVDYWRDLEGNPIPRTEER